MGRVLTSVILGASLLGVNCAERISGPTTPSQSYISNASFYRYFDTKDVQLGKVEPQIAELRMAFPYLKIDPITPRLQKEEYVVGFSIYGNTSTEIITTNGKVTEKPLRLAPDLESIGRKLDQIVGGENYQRLPTEAVYDVVDVPETLELIARIKERQEARWDLEIQLFYLKDASGNLVYSEKGAKIINGITAKTRILRQSSLWEPNEAAYIITGDKNRLHPIFFVRDSLGGWVPVDSIKFYYISADSAKRILQEEEQSSFNIQIKAWEKIKGRPLTMDEIFELMNRPQIPPRLNFSDSLVTILD